MRGCKLNLRRVGDAGDHGCGQNYHKIVKPLLNDLHVAKLDLRSVKKKDVDLRKVHIQERADAFKAENSKAKIVKVLEQLNRIEEQIRDAKRVKFALKGLE